MQVKSATELLLDKTYEAVWYRGQDYADSGRVKIDKIDGKEVQAIVKGTKKYIVKLKLVANGIRRDCSCPYPKGICKHMVAVAILWDEMRGMKRPSNEEVKSYTIAPPAVSRREIDTLFDSPLNADLDKLRVLVEHTAFPSSRLQTHARLPNCPKISTDRGKPLTQEEVIKALKEMERWTNRRSYDSYFCAGEMAAAFSELLDIIERRLSSSDPGEAILIMANCVNWYYQGFNQIIDGSDGVWIFPQVRIGKIAGELLDRDPQNLAWQKFRKIVEKVGDWWGEPELNEKTIAEWKDGRL